MLPTQKKQFKNRLAQFRLIRKLDQKHVATLLGYAKTTRIDRIERGLAVPDLKTALKLAQIYDIPVRIMLDQYYEACREEIRRQKQLLPAFEPAKELPRSENHATEFCTYEEKFGSKLLSEHEIATIRRHSTYLIRKVAEKLGHI